MDTQGIGTDRPVSPLDREAIAHVEVGHTTVSARVARSLVVWFLLMVAAVPVMEIVGPWRSHEAASAWRHLAGLPAAMDQSAAAEATSLRETGVWQRVVTANRAVLRGLGDFETALEDQSSVGQLLRPPMQLALSAWAGAGNERVYVGRDGWLFYRPDVEYVTGHGFLDARELDRRVASTSEQDRRPHPDPRPAIRQFKRDLDARGIALVIVPTPVKPSIHGGQLARASDTPADGVMQNPSYDAFVADLRRDGVLVFDPAPEIARWRTSDGPQYLATDTHWRPEAMQRVAEALAAFVQQQVALPAMPPPRYTVERREARNTGDTAAMLDLPDGQTLYPAERVTLRFVVDAAGDPWRPSRDADILVLGDSFSNVYSLPAMGWGEAAGLVEQVSYALQRPADRIVQNDQGAHATRGLLRRELEGGVDRLAGKRVVIWQFAARELAFGDWQITP